MPTATAEKNTVTLKTELGLKLKVLPSHRTAEECALYKERVEAAKSNFDKSVERLLRQMHADDVTIVKGRTAAGTTYEFALQNKGEVLKVRKVIEKKPVAKKRR